MSDANALMMDVWLVGANVTMVKIAAVMVMVGMYAVVVLCLCSEVVHGGGLFGCGG